MSFLFFESKLFIVSIQMVHIWIESESKNSCCEGELASCGQKMFNSKMRLTIKRFQLHSARISYAGFTCDMTTSTVTSMYLIEASTARNMLAMNMTLQGQFSVQPAPLYIQNSTT